MTTAETKADLIKKVKENGIKSLKDKELVILNMICSTAKKREIEGKAESMLEIIDKYNANSPATFLNFGFEDDDYMPLLAMQELGRRYAGKYCKPKKIKTPEDVYEHVKHYADRQQEHLIVIALNGAHEVIYTEAVTVGLVNMTVVHPREVFANAIKHRATGIILCHNHPSGVHEEASEEDKAITKRIHSASLILGIGIVDHIIISENGYLSFKQEGLL